MTTEGDTDSGYTARLDRSDVVHTGNGEFLLPILLDGGEAEVRVNLTIPPDDAARLHAQLDRLLNRGLTMSGHDLMVKQNGHTSITGASHLT